MLARVGSLQVSKGPPLCTDPPCTDRMALQQRGAELVNVRLLCCCAFPRACRCLYACRVHVARPPARLPVD